ncbi:MAG: hypothetical protein EXQ77_00140 [Thermoleophilia bacterium]|nr:hypothetical protein [Thermoleophilia bacterium]
MKRSRPLALLAAALFGFALLSLVERKEPTGEPIAPARAASPQAHTLAWEERTPATGTALVFRVGSLEVTAQGWRADVAIENVSSVPWSIGTSGADAAFGLMLFPNDYLEEVERRNAKHSLPAVRRARTFEPAPPATLPPGGRWAGVLQAPGALPAGLYVRFVFGPLTAEGAPPTGVPETVVWITDHAIQLTGA